MQPNPGRRVYSAEFKAEVLALCGQPGASVAAVSLAHGLNANLVRKWLVGRGLKRSGLQAPRAVTPKTVPVREPSEVASAATPLQFVAVELATGTAPSSTGAVAGDADIHIELQRGGAKLTVRWPSAQAGACAAWLRELAAGTLK